MDAILKTVSELATSDPYYLAVEKILKSYDTSKSTAENKEILESSYSKEQLHSVVYFTKTLEAQYPAIVQRISQRKSRNKSNLAGDIAILMNGINPIKCLQCDEDYVHTTAENTENNSFSCMLCNRYSHKTCYQNSDVKRGFYFMCTLCIVKYEEKSKSAKANEAPISPQPNKDDGDEDKSESSSSTHTESTVHLNQTPKHRRSLLNTEKDDKWCPLYLQGTCPHGISGRGCSYTHPRRCSYYSKYGEDRWRGCRYGKNCKFFHPRLCLNSVQLKMCLTKSCKDVHLAGTRRFKPREERNSQSSHHNNNAAPYEEQRQRRQQNPASPWQENLHRENPVSPWQESQTGRNPVSAWQPSAPSTSNQPCDPEKSQDFLLKYLENMRADLTKTIENKIESALNAQKQIMKNPNQPEPQPVEVSASQQPSNPNNHQKLQVEEPLKEIQNLSQIPVNHQLSPNPFPLQTFAHLPQSQLPNLLHPHLNFHPTPLPPLHL